MGVIMRMDSERPANPGVRAPLAAVAVVLLTVSADAAALWDDRLQLFVGETVTSDSNVFRISRDRDTRAFLGESQRGDTYTTTTAGFSLDVPVSRQRFQAGSTWNKVNYRRFSDLDYLGRDSRAAWLWQLGDRLSGQLGYNETDALASFGNIQGRVPNSLETRRLHGNAAYLLTPSWQLQAGLAETEQRNGNRLREENDINVRSTDLAVNYISRANNKLGIALRQDDGRYPNRQQVGALLIDNGYTQRGIGLVTDWRITGKSHLRARVDRVHRDYDELSGRNFDGTIFNVAYDWQATGKLGLSALAQRDISPAEDIQTSFVLVEGVALRASYDLSEKVNVAANAGYSRREYLGDPGLALGTTADRTDRVRVFGAIVSYRPTRSLTLRLSGQRETRSSNVPLNDYTANVFSLNALFAF